MKKLKALLPYLAFSIFAVLFMKLYGGLQEEMTRWTSQLFSSNLARVFK